MFKAGIFLMGSNKNQTQIIQEKLGVYQSNILSSILSNIYFTALDIYMSQLIKKYCKRDRAIINPEYLKEITIAENSLKKNSDETLKPHVMNRIANKKKQRALKKEFYFTLSNNNCIIIKYARYADNFLVGIRAAKKTVLKIKKGIIFFFKFTLHLQANKDKTKITHTYCEKAKFLGMNIYSIPRKHLLFKKARSLEKIKRNKSRIVDRVLGMQNKRFKTFKERILKGLKKQYKKAEDIGQLIQWEKTLEKAITQIISLNNLDNSNRQIFSQFVKELKKF